jgi:hypothetical protein
MATGTIRSILVGALVGGVVGYTVWSVGNLAPKPTYREIIQAYNQGRVDALKLNPVSWDLEQACVNLWAGRLPLDNGK